MFRSFCLTFIIATTAAAPARAQTTVDEPDGTPSTCAEPSELSKETRSPDESLDVGDLWHWVRHHEGVLQGEQPAPAGNRFLVVAPTIGSKPSTGLTAGANANMAFFSGDPATTHISTLSGGLKVSQKAQVLSGVRFSIFTDDDRWFIQGDNRLQWTSQNTYALGADALATTGENVKYDYLRFSETAYRTIKRRDLFIGGGLTFSSHQDVRPGDSASATWDQSAYLAYTQAHGFAPDGQRSGGTNIGLLYDTRDNAINAYKGWFANASYRSYFDGFLGGDSTWQELFVDVRTYRRLTHDGRQRLAFWVMSDLVTGGTAPYFDLPTTSSDGRSARGYSEGRFRGPHLVYGEVEYRGSLTASGLVGFVAFANTTTIDSVETGTRLFESWAPGAGFGFRVLLNKRSRTNLATDYGWGKDGSRGFYLGIQEAF